MTEEEALERLQEQAATLDQQVRDIDHDVQRMLHALAGSQEPGHMLIAVQERLNTQQGYIYDLGKVEARIEDLRNRIQERDEKAREQASAERYEASEGHEDHLDWLRPKLEAQSMAQEDERDEQHQHRKGEDRMLEEMHREDRSPEDYLDWWTKRG